MPRALGAVFGGALEVRKPVTQRRVECGLKCLDLGGDRLAFPGFRGADEHAVSLLVESPYVDGDDALCGATPHDPMWGSISSTVEVMSRPAVCQRKTEPTESGPSTWAPSTSGCHDGHAAMSVWMSQMVRIGAWIRISSRVMTGAAALMSTESSSRAGAFPACAVSPRTGGRRSNRATVTAAMDATRPRDRAV
jgi:hypothetical protein